MYIDKLDDILNKYNNTYHSTIKIKPVDVKSSTYINFNKENNKKDHKFKIGDNVRISKCKIIFTKGFVIKKVKNTVPWTYVVGDLNGEEIIRAFYEKELQKVNQKEFKLEKVIKRNGDKL